MSLPPYPREGAWMGMAAMTSRVPPGSRTGGRTVSGASDDGDVRWAGRDGEERAEVQGGGRLATSTAYEVVAEPRPSQRADTKSSPATGNRREDRCSLRTASAAPVPTAAPWCPASQPGIGWWSQAQSTTQASIPRMDQDLTGKRSGEEERGSARAAWVNNNQPRLRGSRERDQKIKADGRQPTRRYDRTGAQAIGTGACCGGRNCCVLGLWPGSASQQRYGALTGCIGSAQQPVEPRRQWAMCGSVPPRRGVVIRRRVVRRYRCSAPPRLRWILHDLCISYIHNTQRYLPPSILINNDQGGLVKTERPAPACPSVPM